MDSQYWLSGLSNPGSCVTIGRPAKEGAAASGAPLDIMIAGDSAGESAFKAVVHLIIFTLKDPDSS